ncbi:MAG: hypothetical protein LBP59_09575 [Planctomycetaceae bacterium]|jgi:hypothetical protein|nr:hypothetical protein [Planctomycetaceae bacterium]
MTNTKKLSICMGCRKKQKNGIQKNNQIIQQTTKIKSPIIIKLFLTLFLLLLFAAPIYGQNLYEQNLAGNNNHNYDHNYNYNYAHSRHNQNGNKFNPNPEHAKNIKTYPLKRKILVAASNNSEPPNNTQTPQDELANKQNIIKKIPWDDLTQPVKQKLSSIIQNHTVYHHIPTQAVFCDPEVYQYFLEHPDLLVGFWESLGVTQIALRETDANRYNLIESTGTVADVGILYRSTNCCIVYAKGEYKNPITTRKIDGEALLVLQSRYARNAENEPIVVCNMDVFVKIDNIGADLLVKLFATSLNKIADGNFEQTLGFVSHVSDTSAISANSVKKLTKSVKNVRENVRNDFTDVVDRVSIRAAKRVEKRLFDYHKNNKITENYEQNTEQIIEQNELKTETNIDAKQEFPQINPQPITLTSELQQIITPKKSAIFTPPKL